MALKINRIWLPVLGVCLLAGSNVEARSVTDSSRARGTLPRDYPHPRVVKLVFDLNSVSPTLADPNPGLIAIAELMRHYGAFGRDSPRLNIVVVLHGKTTELALDAASMAKRVPGATNGSIDVMRSMVGQGVEFVVSRQALANRTIDEHEVQPIVRFGPTAEIIFLDLEASGYIFEGSSSLGKD